MWSEGEFACLFSTTEILIMSLFSKRNNYSPVRVEIQLESLDAKTRTHLWNLIHEDFVNLFIRKNHNDDYLWEAKNIWTDFFVLPINQMPYNNYELQDKVQDLFARGDWHTIFDFIEFILKSNNYLDEIAEKCNSILERELSAYRLINNQFIKITDEIEIEAIESAINTSKDGIKLHLTRSLELLSNRQNPDYRNSIKEAISAVEAFCIEITGDQKATLGEALKHPILKDVFHGSLLKGFSNIYGFTSNAEGIRHALMDEPKLKQEDALFMLVSCSAFVNYLRAKI